MKLTAYVVDYDMAKLGVPIQAVIRMFGETLPVETLVLSKLASDAMLFEVEALHAIG
ncbi:hypothetical protein [Roseinatronobacter monicus]|uniref:hypothetical protein n=1 Tax=Roseinatronobacter monicus TaxID=393481 RepID=UPI0014776162|nr:hypothetical protein [Roseinatronobacter monicus]